MNASYASRQIYNEIFAAGYSAREVSFYWPDGDEVGGVLLNPHDRPLVLVLSQDHTGIRIRYWHDLRELHEGVGPFHVVYAPDYRTMLDMLR